MVQRRLAYMKFFSENHSGDVNIDSGPGGFSSISARNPYSDRVGIRIHIAPERLFTCPESADECEQLGLFFFSEHFVGPCKAVYWVHRRLSNLRGSPY